MNIPEDIQIPKVPLLEQQMENALSLYRQHNPCWLPERVDAEARFFLERIETESEEADS